MLLQLSIWYLYSLDLIDPAQAESFSCFKYLENHEKNKIQLLIT